MTEAHQDVEGAVERLEDLCERAHDWPGDAAIAATVSVGDVKAIKALLTDWRRLKAESKRLREHSDIYGASKQAAALSETRAVLEVLAGAVRSFFANPMTMPPEKRVQFERLKDALTRAAELYKLNG